MIQPMVLEDVDKKYVAEYLRDLAEHVEQTGLSEISHETGVGREGHTEVRLEVETLVTPEARDLLHFDVYHDTVPRSDV